MCQVHWTYYLGCGYGEPRTDELCQNGSYNAVTLNYHCTGMQTTEDYINEWCRKPQCRICFPDQKYHQQSSATPASEASSSYTPSYNATTGHYQQSSATPASEVSSPYTPSWNAATGQQGYAQGHASEPQGGPSYSKWMVHQDPSSQDGAAQQRSVYNQENVPEIDFKRVDCSYYKVDTEVRRRKAQVQKERYHRDKERKHREE